MVAVGVGVGVSVPVAVGAGVFVAVGVIVGGAPEQNGIEPPAMPGGATITCEIQYFDNDDGDGSIS